MDSPTVIIVDVVVVYRWNPIQFQIKYTKKLHTISSLVCTLSLVIFIFTSFFIAAAVAAVATVFSTAPAPAPAPALLVVFWHRCCCNLFVKNAHTLEQLSFNYMTDILRIGIGYGCVYAHTKRVRGEKKTHASSRMNIKREFEVKKCTSACERTLFCTLLS